MLQAIGFDMDYTLSQYRPETFEVLAYNLTINKLINNFNYPKVRPAHTATSCMYVCRHWFTKSKRASQKHELIHDASDVKLAFLLLQELLDFEFDFRYMMRGLIIDKKRGNILKMDRHKYVKVAFHGFRKLSREERLITYAHARVRLHLNY